MSKLCFEMTEVYNFIENPGNFLYLLKLTIYNSFLPLPFLPFDTEGRLVMFQSHFLYSKNFLFFLSQTWSNMTLMRLRRKCQHFYLMFVPFCNTTHHLYIVLRVHHPKSSLVPSPFIPPLPSPLSSTPLSLW